MVISILRLELDYAGYIKCPICDGSNHKKRLHIAKDKGVFRCAKCGTSGTAIQLYGWFVYDISPETLKSDTERRKKLFKEIMEKNGSYTAYTVYAPSKNDEEIGDIPAADIADRNKTYSKMLEKLSLERAHYNNLIKRGLRHTDIVQNGYKSTVTEYAKGDEIAKVLRNTEACSISSVPGFYKKKTGGYQLKKSQSGFYIPVRALSNNFRKNPRGPIEGLQIRYDNPQNDLRYVWLSSRLNDKTKEYYSEGCGASTWAHFVGYPEREVIITEGPLKSDIICRFTDMPVLGIPGVNSISHLTPMLDSLAELGVRQYRIAFDMDLYDKPEVLKALYVLIDLLKEKNMAYKMFEWDKNYKGLDDYLLAMYLKAGNQLDPCM